MHLAYYFSINAHRLDCLCSTRSSYQLESQLIEGICQLLHFFLILISHSKEDAAINRHVHACASNCLVEGTSIMIIYTHYLASRFHLRSEGDIHISHLVEGEYWCLHCYIWLWSNQARFVAQLLQAGTQCHLSSYIHHLDVSNLAQEWYCTGRTRIYLNYKYLIIYYYILDIQKALYMEAYCQSSRVVNDGENHLGRECLRRIHRNGVTGMNAGSFNVLHNTWDYHINTI